MEEKEKCPEKRTEKVEKVERAETTEEGRRIRSGGIGDDNWKHRSKKMKCEGCMFFVLKNSEVAQPSNHKIGRCRESSPTLKGWPAVFSDDWCGAHKLDEDKL